MIEKITRTTRFKKDFKLALKQGKDVSKFEMVVGLLVSGEELPTQYRDHLLINYDDYRECHIQPDWLMIYRVDGNELVLYRLGSHSELFNK